MAANHLTTETNAAARALDLVSRMERLAANGEWSRAEKVVAKLNTAVLEVPSSEQISLMASVVRSIENVQTLAKTSRAEVTEKLSGIRRGRAATRAYAEPGAHG